VVTTGVPDVMVIAESFNIGPGLPNHGSALRIGLDTDIQRRPETKNFEGPSGTSNPIERCDKD
jgi:hypothetical protein